ncbi:MAG: DUF885 domain-containing protein [Planctomycetota bacterium]
MYQRMNRFVFLTHTVAFMITATVFADPHADLHKLLDDYWQARMMRSPERATYLGDHRFDDQLTDYSEKAIDEDRVIYKRFADLLKSIPRDKLSPDDHLNADLFQHILDDADLLDTFPEHFMPIKQQESFHITLGLLQQYHKFDTVDDCANYAKRLRLVSKQIDDMMAAMDKGIRLGIVRPKITVQQTLPQIEAMIATDPRKSVLYPTTFNNPGPNVITDDKAHLNVEVSVIVANAALSKLRAYLQTTYLPKCRDTVGYGQLPDGKAWYRAASRVHTTTKLDPETIHQIGLDELKRIHADMLEIAREVGFDSDLRAFIEKMRTDPVQHNKTPAEIMRRHTEILRRSDANLSKMFGVLPKIPYELKEMEPFRAEAAPEAYYYNAPDDGSRPAYFYVNTVRPETRPIYTMEALAYHEAQPGHHFQLAIAQEKKNWPMFRRFESINAYIEGWALYSELLGYQLGGYNDPYSRFGQLTYDTWRSSRLVVDTGMHAMGWTRERAIQFMKDNTALSEQNIVSEVDRYIAWPGQALGYKIGQLEILKIRREAETRLSRRFNIRAFHDELLKEGSLPLSMLRDRMTKWIDAQLEEK